jgi:hypothetical protein
VGWEKGAGSRGVLLRRARHPELHCTKGGARARRWKQASARPGAARLPAPSRGGLTKRPPPLPTAAPPSRPLPPPLPPPLPRPQIVGTSMHGCFPNGTDTPGHSECLPRFLAFSDRAAPPLETLETRGADVLVPRRTSMT